MAPMQSARGDTAQRRWMEAYTKTNSKRQWSSWSTGPNQQSDKTASENSHDEGQSISEGGNAVVVHGLESDDDGKDPESNGNTSGYDANESNGSSHYGTDVENNPKDGWKDNGGNDNDSGNSGGIRGAGAGSNGHVNGITTLSTSAVAAAATSTSISSTSAAYPDSDSNGAQRLSWEPVSATATAPLTESHTATPTMVTSVILSTSTVVMTAPNTIVTSFIPLMTTSVVIVPATTFRSIGIGAAGAFGSDFSGFAGLPKPTTKGDANDDGDYRKHRGTGNSTDAYDYSNTNKGSKKGKNDTGSLSPTAEHALISVSSIGAFVIVCFLCWLVWRAFRKHKQRRNLPQANVSESDNSRKPFAATLLFSRRVYGKIASKNPFLSRRQTTWRSLKETSSLPSMKSATPVAMMASNLEASRMANAASSASSNQRKKDGETIRTSTSDSNNGSGSSLPPAIPPQVHYATGLGIQFESSSPQPPQKQLDASSTHQGVTTFYSHSPSSSQSSTNAPAPFTDRHSDSSKAVGQPVTQRAMMPLEQQQQQQQLPIQQPQPPQPFVPSNVSLSSDTLRSRMPDPFYNQSQLARQPSDAYDPTRRQVNRVSELSSLSSGFGDGEMLMLIPEQPQRPRVDTANTALPPIPIPTQPMTSKGQLSWMRNTKRMTYDTVYSEAGDDQPSRFRSVDSWVKQQTGRVRRGQASIDATTDASARGSAGGKIKLMPGNEPGIPHPLPEEQRLTMMMDDEVPRRPDSLLIGFGQKEE